MGMNRVALAGSLAPVETGDRMERRGRGVVVGGARRFFASSTIGGVAAVLLVLIGAVALLAPLLAPYPPLEADYAATQAPPSVQHLLGTDHLGRDTLSRIVFGARVTLVVSIASVGLGASIGLLWGITAGYLGHRFDIVSQRLVEILMAFPTLILAMLLMVSLGAGLVTVVVAVGVSQIPLATRISRSVVLSVKETSYVEAARCAGATPWRIMGRHITPQCVAPIMVVATVNLGAAVFTEAALSFLGVGVPPPTPSWGNMLGGVLAQSFNPPWWLVVFPGLAIGATVMAANLLGDALRDFFDPRTRRR